jgi:hypothetical protein
LRDRKRSVRSDRINGSYFPSSNSFRTLPDSRGSERHPEEIPPLIRQISFQKYQLGFGLLKMLRRRGVAALFDLGTCGLQLFLCGPVGRENVHPNQETLALHLFVQLRELASLCKLTIGQILKFRGNDLLGGIWGWGRRGGDRLLRAGWGQTRGSSGRLRVRLANRDCWWLLRLRGWILPRRRSDHRCGAGRRCHCLRR